MAKSSHKTHPLKIDKRGDLYHLSGSLDESANLEVLGHAKSTLKLDVGAVHHINSLGILKLLALIDKWGDRPLEYHRCSTAFLYQIGMLPALLGPRPRRAKVVSAELHFACGECSEQFELHIEVADCTFEADDVTVPPAACPKCGSACPAVPEVLDLFRFMRPASP